MKNCTAASFIILFLTLLSSCSGTEEHFEPQKVSDNGLLVVTQNNSTYRAYGVEPGKTLSVMSILWSAGSPLFIKSEKQFIAFKGLDTFSGSNWADTIVEFQKSRTESLLIIDPKTGQRLSGAILNTSPNFFVTNGSMGENTYTRDQLQTTLNQIHDGVAYMVQLLQKNQQETRNLIAVDIKTGQFLWKFPLAGTDFSQPGSAEIMLSFNGSQGFLGLPEASFSFDVKTGRKIKDYAIAKLRREANGDLYALTDKNGLVALDGKSAAKKWEFQVDGGGTQPLQYTFSNDQIFITSQGTVTAIDAQTGLKKWSFSNTRNLTVTPSQIAGKTVYLVDKKGMVNAIDIETGENKWTSKPLVSDEIVISKVAFKDDKVFVQIRPDFVTVLNSATGTETYEYSIWGADSGPIHDFMVYDKSDLNL